MVCVGAFDDLKLERKGIIAVTMPGFGTTTGRKATRRGLPRRWG
jgi:NAD+ synthase (glutamine-hydrolysing)